MQKLRVVTESGPWRALGHLGTLRFLMEIASGLVGAGAAYAAVARFLGSLPTLSQVLISAGLGFALAASVGAVLIWASNRVTRRGSSGDLASTSEPVNGPDYSALQRKARALDEVIGTEYDRLVAIASQEERPYAPGLLIGPVADLFKRRRYGELGLSDIFVPDMAQGRLALQLMANTFRELGGRPWTDREQGLLSPITDQLRDLESCAERVVDTYAPLRGTGFRAPHGLPGLGASEANTRLDLNDKAKKLQTYCDEISPQSTPRTLGALTQ